jgi:hypothetical protein
MQALPRLGLQLKLRRAGSSPPGRIGVSLEIDPTCLSPYPGLPGGHELLSNLPLCTLFLPALSVTSSGKTGTEPIERRVRDDSGSGVMACFVNLILGRLRQDDWEAEIA